MTVKALAIPIIYWISITSMAISTKIKANILSLNHPQFMNISATNFLLTLSSGVRSHFFFFFMNKEGVKPPTKQTRFPFQQVPH